MVCPTDCKQTTIEPEQFYRLGPKPVLSSRSCSRIRTVRLPCPFCLKPFKNYHSLQRHASSLSQTAADEGRHCWKLPRVEYISVLPDRTFGTVEDEPEINRQIGHSSMSARLHTADVLRLYCRSTGEQSACISSSWSRLLFCGYSLLAKPTIRGRRH